MSGISGGLAVRLTGFGVVGRGAMWLYVSPTCEVVEVSAMRQVVFGEMCWICWSVVRRFAEFWWSLACVQCLCLLGGVLSEIAGGLSVRVAESDVNAVAICEDL